MPLVDPQLLGLLLQQRAQEADNARRDQLLGQQRSNEALRVGMGIAMQPEADINAWLPLLREQGLAPAGESALVDAQKAERTARKNKEAEAQTAAQGQTAAGVLTNPQLAPELTLPQVMSQLRAVEGAGAQMPGGSQGLLNQLDIARTEAQVKQRAGETATNQERSDKLRTEGFANENVLRDEFRQSSAPFIIQRDAYDRVVESVKQPSAAGDLSLIFAYMKLLDPNSSVREGEQATALNAGGVPSWVTQKYNALFGNPNGRLLDKDRQDFRRRAQKLISQAARRQKALEDNYRGLARSSGVRPGNVVLDFRTGEAPTGDSQAASDLDGL